MRNRTKAPSWPSIGETDASRVVKESKSAVLNVRIKPSVKAKGQARRQKLMPNKAPAAAKGAPAPKGAAPKAGAAKADKAEKK